MISFSKPFVLYLILLLLPANIYNLYRFKSLLKAFGMGENKDYDSLLKSIRLRFFSRTICWSLAFFFLIFAMAGPIWGTEPQAVQKSGNSVAFVFDISYSMMAKDMPQGNSRLETAKVYAAKLLEQTKGVSTAVILTKGSSVLSIPLTEDLSIVQSLLYKLSPELLTSSGSDLASGIETAIRSFPQPSANTNTIVLFTDGDETLSNMKDSVLQAIKHGMNVVLVGFGSKNEIEIVTGDGVRTAKTSLKEKELIAICQDVQEEIEKKQNSSIAKAQYVNALEVGAALKVLKAISFDSNPKENTVLTLYEIKSVSHHRLFIVLSIIFFVIGFLISELKKPKAKKTKLKITSLLLLPLLFSSCTDSYSSAGNIFQGVFYWGQQNYQKASAHFLQAQENSEIKEDTLAQNYAQYGLAVTYLMQNETEAASKKFEVLSNNTPELIQFGALYNNGIISYRKGDYEKAADFFKKALLVDSNNLDAKINLELSINQIQVQNASNAQEIVTGDASAQAERNAKQDAIFSLIKENDKNQWKNQQQNKDENILDY